MKLEKRKVNKKNLAILIGGIIIVLLILIALMMTLFSNSTKETQDFIVMIDGEEVTSYANEVEYGSEIDYSPEGMLLEAYYLGEDVTAKLTYEEIEITSLDTYEITYTYDTYTFVYEMKVVDTVGPTIIVNNVYTITKGTTFDLGDLEMSCTDAYDGKITTFTYTGTVDTNTVGTYPIVISVSDSSGNEGKFGVDIEVVEESSSNTNTTGVVSNPDDITVYISKTLLLPDGWSPSDLVSVAGSHYLRSEAATAYNTMVAAANADGVEIILVSSYRSQEYQTSLYNSYYAADPEGADFYSAIPRSSEHELGLAVDVSYDYSLHADLDEYPVGIWMIENCYKYGWIMSYPEDKTDITGYMYEPWHYRYVGVELATYLYNNNLTLGEYYGY